jgi:hypothetical protein
VFSGDRNVLKATIDVPQMGEVNFNCTHLDHLDENWRMKQINAMIQSSDEPHILAGGLNSLDETDYSQERWTDIVNVNWKNLSLIYIYIYIYTHTHTLHSSDQWIFVLAVP